MRIVAHETGNAKMYRPGGRVLNRPCPTVMRVDSARRIRHRAVLNEQTTWIHDPGNGWRPLPDVLPDAPADPSGMLEFSSGRGLAVRADDGSWALYAADDKGAWRRVKAAGLPPAIRAIESPATTAPGLVAVQDLGDSDGDGTSGEWHLFDRKSPGQELSCADDEQNHARELGSPQ